MDGTFPADDDNRIALKPLPDVSDCQRDYINACYVDVREFIVNFSLATQTITNNYRMSFIACLSVFPNLQGYSIPNKFMVTQGKQAWTVSCDEL